MIGRVKVERDRVESPSMYRVTKRNRNGNHNHTTKGIFGCGMSLLLTCVLTQSFEIGLEAIHGHLGVPTHSSEGHIVPGAIVDPFPRAALLGWSSSQINLDVDLSIVDLHSEQIRLETISV